MKQGSKGVCTDRTCYGTKLAAFNERKMANAKAEGQKVITGKAAKEIAPYNSDMLPHNSQYVNLDETTFVGNKSKSYREILGKDVKPTLVETGRGVIEVLTKTDVKKALKDKGIKDVAVAGRTGGSLSDSERKEREKTKQETRFRNALYAKIREAAPAKLDRDDLELVASAMFWGLESIIQKAVINLWEWEIIETTRYGYKHPDHQATVDAKVPKLSDKELARFLLDCAHARDLHAWSYSKAEPDTLLASAKRYKIDVAAVKKELAAEAKKPVKAAAANGKAWSQRGVTSKRAKRGGRPKK